MKLKKNIIWSSRFLFLVVFSLMSGGALAAIVPLNNGNFASPDVATGVASSIAPDGWETIVWTGGSGMWLQDNPIYPSADQQGIKVYSGASVAHLGQTTAEVITSGKVYTGSFWHNNLFNGVGRATLYLMGDDGGGTATPIIDTGPRSAGGIWAKGSVSFAADDYPAMIGQQLRVEVKGEANGGYEFLDTVKLEVANWVGNVDFNSDYDVNLQDFALFANEWYDQICSPNDWCNGVDVDRNREVDLADLSLLVQKWLISSGYMGTRIEVTINAEISDVADFGFCPHNQYSSLATYGGNIYVVWNDANLRPFLTKINEATSVSETYPLDHNETDVYYAYNDGHHLFSIGIDKNGYIHILGDMHHGGNPWYRQGSANPLPNRFSGSEPYGWQLYWVSQQPEDISGFDFVGDSASRSIPGWGFSYQHLRTDVNGELYMAARHSVRNPRVHEPGTMGLGLFRYNAGTQQWTALGGYPTTDPVYNYKAVVWEPHGYSPDSWYQPYFANFKIDKNNRLHVTTPLSADSTQSTATDIVYGYSDDGGQTFHRPNGQQITSLPMRVAAGPDQAGIAISIDDTGGFAAYFTGLFWDANSSPAVVYQVARASEMPDPSQQSYYRYYNPVSGLWTSAAYPISVPSIRGDHYTGPDGIITFIGNDSIYRTGGFEQLGIEYNLSLTMPPCTGGGIIRAVDESLLRDRNILRGLSRQGDKIVVVSIEFK